MGQITQAIYKFAEEWVPDVLTITERCKKEGTRGFDKEEAK